MILMYHHVVPKYVFDSHRNLGDDWDCVHSVEALERHIRFLKWIGYQIVPIEIYVQSIYDTGLEPPNTAVLTFDDGWIDNYQYAFPILLRLGVSGTFFVTSQHLNEGKSDPRKMSRPELIELHEAGMTIGAHSRKHLPLAQIGKQERFDEIVGSKQDLEVAVDAPIQFFAYPKGSFDAETAEAVSNAGFTAACSSLGPARNERSSCFWLFRDVFSNGMMRARDLYRLSKTARRLLEFRVQNRLRNHLASSK